MRRRALIASLVATPVIGITMSEPAAAQAPAGRLYLLSQLMPRTSEQPILLRNAACRTPKARHWQSVRQSTRLGLRQGTGLSL